jgi:hypothetical protein
VTRDDVERVLLVGRSRSLCVDARLMDEFPGYVQTVTLLAPSTVTIELNPHGLDEGGPAFWASFESLDEAIASVATFVGKPIEHWKSVGCDYPAAKQEANIEEGHQRLRTAIINKAVRLPQGAFALREDGFWNRLPETL